MKKGITLVELLVVIGITLILAGGIFYAYREVFQKGVSQSLVAKNEQEAQFLISTLVSELSSVGFGIDRSRLQILNNGGNLNDVGNSFIAISGNEVRFLSLATRQNNSAGCWSYVDNNGNIATQTARDYLGRECNTGNNRWKLCICLEPITKSCSGNCVVQNCADPQQNQSCRNMMVFDISNNPPNYPNDFITRYYLAQSSTASPLCANGTQTLMKQVGNDAPQPIIDCVGAFRVRYITNQNGSAVYSDSVDNVNNLLGLRLCLLLQIGGRQSVAMDVPQFSQSCGGGPVPNNNWRFYRWSAIEVDIPLKNIR